MSTLFLYSVFGNFAFSILQPSARASPSPSRDIPSAGFASVETLSRYTSRWYSATRSQKTLISLMTSWYLH